MANFKVTKKIHIISIYIALLALALIVLAPFAWMITTSLKEPGTVFEYPPKWIPQPLTWQNYTRVWDAIPLGRGYINSLFVSLLITLGQLITCSLAAYAFSRLKFPGRNKIFFLYLATLMVPTHVTMIPIFIILRALPEFLNSAFRTNFWTSDLYMGNFYVGKPLGLDSYFALIVPFCFSAYGTFLLRQFFITIPKDYEDAARMDGCNDFQIYYKIILPLAKPALATLATFTFMNAWKNYLWPLIIANSPELMPLSVLLQWLQGLYTTDWTLLMAGSVIVLLPVVIVFSINQKYFSHAMHVGTITH
jgi:multiple sugar transport system permease protein